MSSNKFKYFVVSQESTVKARNKTEAAALARGRRGISGKVLDQTTAVDRISADEAKSHDAESMAVSA